MKKKLLKRIGMQMIGGVVAQCFILPHNPFGLAYFAAAYLQKPTRAFIFPIVLVSMLLTMPATVAIKYGLAMLVIAVIIELIERIKNSCGKYLGGVIAAISLFSMEVAKAGLSINPEKELIAGFFEYIMVFALVIVFSVGIAAVVTPRSNRFFTNEEKISLGIMAGAILFAIQDIHILEFSLVEVIIYFGVLFIAYCYGSGMGALAGAVCGIVMTLWEGNIAILGTLCFCGALAGAFRQLGKLGSSIIYLVGLWLLGTFYAPIVFYPAQLSGILAATAIFLLLPKKLAVSYETVGREEGAGGNYTESKNSMKEMAGIFKRMAKSMSRFHGENDISFASALQLNQTAAILENFSEGLENERENRKKTGELIKQRLQRYKVSIKSIRITEQRNHRLKIKMVARNTGGGVITMKEVAAHISKSVDKRMRPTYDCKTIMNGEYATFSFTEEPNFMMMYGMAGKTKEGEKISGDNFSFMELEEGQVLMGIVDGMGSGKEASEDSEVVVELIEDLLKAGFKEESAINLINSILLSKGNNQSSTAVDIAITDLYSGKCNFVKLGAAATFIKRNQWIEVMKSTTLPVGILREVDYESTSKKLYDGDYVIMVSDGILEAFPGENKENEFTSFLMDIRLRNPKELADYIINYACKLSENDIRDDMTVLVAGIWKKAT
ncbi:MAG: SpoIIE family protein phosphatase [Clostridiales bacterium]|nr:SpoIIE family protein phosphatase [Clostridiales bacterium]